jgi:hypothetical protein
LKGAEMNFKINTDTPGNKLGYGQVPFDKRGKITGTIKRTNRSGGDITNAEYAKEHGISKRAASKQRRGY